MNRIFAALALVIALCATSEAMATNPNPVPKPKPQQPANCIKQPEIVKKTPATPKPAPKPQPIAKLHTEPNTNSVPHFTIFNFFNSFYTKDTLDHLQVL